jgi:hypothetical protein
MTSSPFLKSESVKRRKSGVRILTGNPVDRGGDSVLVTSLERVDNTENLSGVATSGSRV